MDIIREYCQPKTIGALPVCVVRTKTHANSLAHFDELFSVAQSDFPDLHREDCEVVHYGGQRYRGTYGIEFFRVGEIPESYQKIEHLEYRL